VRDRAALLRRARTAAGVLLCAWVAAAFAWSATHGVALVDPAARGTRLVSRWYADSPRALRLAELLRRADAVLPLGQPVALRTAGAENEALQTRLWAQFFLPQRDVVLESDARAVPGAAAALVCFECSVRSDAAWREVATLPGGEVAVLRRAEAER
jgi:hypothetical protein